MINVTIPTSYEVTGTELQGRIEETYDNLVRAFGDPSGHLYEHTQWTLRLDGHVVEIYWQTEEYGGHIDENTEWSINGRTSAVVGLVQRAIRERIGR